MTNEELEKRVEFIIEHQAQLTAKVEELASIQSQSEIRLRRVEESFVLLVQLAKIMDSRLDTLTQNVDALTEKVTALTDAQKNTDERLNTLIGVVERYISEGRNGKSQG
jgi:vacuolar-type H+-ATPase subunit I/STV1